MTAQHWDICIVEWLWNLNDLSLYTAAGQISHTKGSYAEVVQLLAQLGSQGWEVATCATAGNWLLWTLKRPVA